MIKGSDLPNKSNTRLNPIKLLFFLNQNGRKLGITLKVLLNIDLRKTLLCSFVVLLIWDFTDVWSGGNWKKLEKFWELFLPPKWETNLKIAFLCFILWCQSVIWKTALFGQLYNSFPKSSLYNTPKYEWVFLISGTSAATPSLITIRKFSQVNLARS